MKGEKIAASLARNILMGSLTATAWTFETLITMGMMTVEAFLSPSYYGEMPSFSLDDLLNPPKIAKKKKQDAPKEMTIRHSIWRLQKQGFVRREGGVYNLTEKGRKLARYIWSVKKTAEKKWDGKYRVVIFDIPEKERRWRDWFRQELYLLSYKKLQESVFISKLSLTPELVKEIKRKKMGNCVNYLLVDKIYKNIF